MLSKKTILASSLALCFAVIGCKEEAKTGNGANLLI